MLFYKLKYKLSMNSFYNCIKTKLFSDLYIFNKISEHIVSINVIIQSDLLLKVVNLRI